MKAFTPLFTLLKNYFLIGDLHSAALVSDRGSIDWLCWPHFDSPSIFGKILDPHKGGYFSVDAADWKAQTDYRPDTAIVETRFRRRGQRFTMIDFMVPQTMEGDVLHLLVRKFRNANAKLRLRLFFNPRPGYGKIKPDLRRGRKKLFMPIGKELLILYVPPTTRVTLKPAGAELEFTLHPGQEIRFVTEYSKKEVPSYTGENYETQVERFWKQWVKRGTYTPEHRKLLVRSAITLKLMQFYPTGALIAAPTTSLPETIGGERNWDYRYVWVRDATLILYGLQLLGHTEEAVRFFNYIEKVTQACDQKNIHLKPLYTIGGKAVPPERELKWTGYRYSRPVRIGNEAGLQFQLDVYGAVIDAYHFMRKRGVILNSSSKALILHLAERIEALWRKPDNGIWEIRQGQRPFIYSRVMAWVGIDRLVHMRDELNLTPAQTRHYQTLEKTIREWIWKQGYDPQRKIFRQYPRASGQDATNFLFVLLKFLKKRGPVTRGVIANAAQTLSQGPYVYRYKNHDGFRGKEGTFFLCSFWHIALLAATGKIKKARELLKTIEKNIPKSGLLSEEIDPETKEYLGNFPQAFSHIGYIMSVHFIEKALARKKQVS